jgi:hypothetical protein
MRLQPPRAVTIAVFTTITLIFWIFVSVYSILTTAPETNVPPHILEPLPSPLNPETLNKLPGKLFFEKGQTSPFSNSRAIPAVQADIAVTPEDIAVQTENTITPEDTTDSETE